MTSIPVDANRQSQLVAMARAAIGRGDIELGERLCREMQAVGWADARVWMLIADVACRVGRSDVALAALERAKGGDSSERHRLAQLAASLPAPSAAPTGALHVIRAWGQGFWSDVDHVLGQLLVAEITGRIPLVLWGANSRFRGGLPNAWEHFFEPVAESHVASGPYFPPKWSDQNLAGPELGAFTGPWSRLAFLPFFGRAEPTTVSDFHAPLAAVVHWLPATHPLCGKPLHEVYQALVQKYLRVQAPLAHQADEWAARLGLQGKQPVLAVHVRGSDKAVEMGDMRPVFAAYEGAIASQLHALGADARVLLLTDWEPAAEAYRKKFGTRLIETQSIRTSGGVGLHFQSDADGRALGQQVVVDTLLASRCQALVGMAYSNVSLFMSYFAALRSMPRERISLLGPNQHANLNWGLLQKA